ncbi:MAG: hypothetical protein JRH05_05700 [Deltaproteobacteria bacterium]|nr:hypothetical protein [Deltaproteobacteria bacterium]MBW1934850.1 hypothetical protein [Deltaproteobacteria bacterium]MBW2102160.1 hypothetical protein [Deltaproteobacteria bacterium]RLC10584.1 MAG: hypothetical protein DRH43_06025 [Deltaproteobacteria bacterium]
MNKAAASAYVAVMLLFLAMAGGCGTGRTETPSQFGKSYKELFRAQVINPEAPRDRAPVSGMPGYIAVQIYNERYLPAIAGEESRGRSGGVGMSRKATGYR